jgi:opacity protein-like surface antigen
MQVGLKVIFTIPSLVMIHLFHPAQAEEVGDIFGGFFYSQTIAKDESSLNLGTFKPTTLGIGLSVVAIPNLAVDGYVFTGVNDSSNTLTPTSTMSVSAKDGYGFNLRPYLPLSRKWSIYAKLGRQYGTQETIVKRGSVVTVTSTDYARTIYGLGTSYSFNDQWGVGLDYTKSKRVPSRTTSTALISIGLRYKF